MTRPAYPCDRIHNRRHVRLFLKHSFRLVENVFDKSVVPEKTVIKNLLPVELPPAPVTTFPGDIRRKDPGRPSDVVRELGKNGGRMKPWKRLFPEIRVVAAP